MHGCGGADTRAGTREGIAEMSRQMRSATLVVSDPRRRVYALTLLALLLAMVATLSLQQHVAHAAATPVVVQAATNDDLSSGTSYSKAFSSNVTSGDRLEVSVAYGGGGCWTIGLSQLDGSAPSLVTSESDNVGDYVALYDAAITSGGNTDTVSLTLTQTCGSSTFVQSAMTIIEVSGALAPNSSAVGRRNGTAGTTANITALTLTQQSSGVDELDLGAYIDPGKNVTVNVTGSETQLGTKNDQTVNIEWDQGSAQGQGGFEFDTGSGVNYADYIAEALPSS